MTRREKNAWFPLFLALMLAVPVAGCARPVDWAKPGIEHDQMLRDRAACKRWARSEGERHYRRDNPFADQPIAGSTDTFRTQMQHYEGARTRDTLFEQCMRERGYTPARK